MDIIFLVFDNDFWVYTFLVGIPLLVLLVGSIKRRLPRKITMSHTPVLLVGKLQGDMLNGASGLTPSGYYYTYIVSGVSLFSRYKTSGMYSVELPYRSGAHIVGIQRKSPSLISMTSTAMEPVVLEGDYVNYFELFADNGQQSKTRYVLDPSAMVFTIDFCRSYNWEILDDTLYFESSGLLPAFDVVDRFIDEIRPAIEVASDRSRNPYKMSYVNNSVRKMYCPLCSALLVAEENMMRCPNQHGYLVTGQQMVEMRYKGRAKPSAGKEDETEVSQSQTSRQLVCPYCHNMMKTSKFAFTSVDIDICSKCMYRWVDKTEASTILLQSID